MTTGDVPDDDMNENLFPFNRREGGLPSDDAEKLLHGESPAAGSTPEVRAVADALAALCQPAHRGELAGEKAAVAAFAAAKEQALAPDQPRRRSVLSAFTGAKLAVAAVAGSLALGGVAAAACTGSLPAPFQDVAHTLGAPGAESDGVAGSDDPTGTGTPATSPSTSPSGTHKADDGHRRGHGPSAFAICWFVVHKADGAAGGPWADHSDGDSVKTDGDVDHGRGRWSAAYAKLQAEAAANGQTVVDFCTALLANHTHKPHPSATKHGDKHGNGDPGHDNHQGTSGRGHGSDGHGSGHSSGDGSSRGSGDGSGSGSGDGHQSGGSGH